MIVKNVWPLIQAFSKVSCELGRLRRPERFFVVLALFAWPQARQKAPTPQKRSMQRLCLCTIATFERPAALSGLSDIWLEPYRPVERNRNIFHNLICKIFSKKLYFKELFI